MRVDVRDAQEQDGGVGRRRMAEQNWGLTTLMALLACSRRRVYFDPRDSRIKSREKYGTAETGGPTRGGMRLMEWRYLQSMLTLGNTRVEISQRQSWKTSGQVDDVLDENTTDLRLFSVAKRPSFLIGPILPAGRKDLQLEPQTGIASQF
ncbi:uncharacterized protein BJX67DRAFT_97895 [Aspergillus lucknowensis]|uniref:Uncharacterized protein n=1 Tax=Aspergillus lucknowensis TaxID=176173 RepID=A0ABR4M644_9EURO